MRSGKSANGDDLSSGGNATSNRAAPSPTTNMANGTFSITAGEDILFGPDNDSTTGGICYIIIQFDNTDG